MGYLGIDSTEMFWEGFRVPADMVLGGQEGQGFKQFMALELGRVNVAARGLGLARSAFDHAIAYAVERETFSAGRSADHQSIQIKLAQMATKIRAAEGCWSLRRRRAQGGSASAPTWQAGMAKPRDRDPPQRSARWTALRIHGGRGLPPGPTPSSASYRDAPLLILGEGSNEIQHLIIARRLLEARRNA